MRVSITKGTLPATSTVPKTDAEKSEVYINVIESVDWQGSLRCTEFCRLGPPSSRLARGTFRDAAVYHQLDDDDKLNSNHGATPRFDLHMDYFQKAKRR